MRRLFVYIVVLLPSLFLVNSCGGHSHGEHSPLVDTICSQLSESRYKDIGVTDSLSAALLSAAGDNNEMQMVACNSMAYSALMAMDYAYARELYDSVLATSHCEIERLVADVGL